MIHWLSTSDVVQTWPSDQGTHFQTNLILEINLQMKLCHHLMTSYFATFKWHRRTRLLKDLKRSSCSFIRVSNRFGGLPRTHSLGSEYFESFSATDAMRSCLDYCFYGTFVWKTFSNHAAYITWRACHFWQVQAAQLVPVEKQILALNNLHRQATIH